MATADSAIASVPGRYAGALFDLANSAGQVSEVEADLSKFQDIFDGSDDFRRLVNSPLLSAEDQQAALGAVLKTTDIGALTSNFFGLIAKNRRLFAAPAMIAAFKTLAADARGEVTAEVTSAMPLSEAQVASLKATLKESLGKDVALEATVDPSILGGLIVKLGSQMVDSSLKTKLDGMKAGLKA